MSLNASEIETRINQLSELLNSGSSTVTIDGVTTAFRSTGEIEKQISSLKRDLQVLRGETPSSAFKNISLSSSGGAF